MWVKHRSTKTLPIMMEVVGAATLGAFAVLLMSSLPGLRRYIKLKLI